MNTVKVGLIVAGILLLPIAVMAETNTYTVVLKDHVFMPAEIKIPANQKVTLIVDNQDATPEEFESKQLKREKIIAGNSKGKIAIGPLSIGEYSFVGEFHEEQAKGKIIVE